MGATNPATGNATGPTNNYLGSSAQKLYDAAPGGSLAAEAIQPAPGGQPHANMQPYQVVSFCICQQGIFPSRN
jgi:microcystin-dependent protein